VTYTASRAGQHGIHLYHEYNKKKVKLSNYRPVGLKKVEDGRMA